MDSEESKLFIGGITWDTTEDKLKDYFSKYGDVTHSVVMREKVTGRPRGFGFVIFSDPNALLSVLRDTHTIDGRMEGGDEVQCKGLDSANFGGVLEIKS